MIKESKTYGRFYLYSHKRLDTGKIFYIGIGTKYRGNNDYSRSKQKGKQRSGLWNNIVSKSKYEISIIFEDDDYEIIKKREIELIQYHGKICNSTGTLANFTDGGDGVLGFRNINLIKPVYIYDSNGVFQKDFSAYVDCAKFLNLKDHSAITLSIDKNLLVKNYIIKSKKTDTVEKVENIKVKLSKRLSKPVFQISLAGEILKLWQSTSEASFVLKISGGHIREVCKGDTNRKSAGGFLWKYK